MPRPARERPGEQVRQGPCAARFASGAVRLLLLIPMLAGCPLLTTPPSEPCKSAADCPSGYTCDRPTGNCLKQAADAARTDAVAVDATALDGLRPDQAVVDTLSADQDTQDAASPDLPPVDGAALDQGLSDQMATDLVGDASGPPDAGGPDAPTDSGQSPDAVLDAGGGEDAIGDASGPVDTASLPDTPPATDATQPPADAGSPDTRCLIELIASTAAEPRRVAVEGNPSTGANRVVVAAGAVSSIYFNSRTGVSSSLQHSAAVDVVDVAAVGLKIFAANGTELTALNPQTLVADQSLVNGAEDLALYGSSLYFAKSGSGDLWVTSAGDLLTETPVPTSPTLAVQGLQVHGSLLLALGQAHPQGTTPATHVQVFGLDDPAAPSDHGDGIALPDAQSCSRAAVIESRVFVVCGDKGLFCTSIPDVNQEPSSCSSWQDAPVYHDVAAHADKIYAATSSGVLRYLVADQITQNGSFPMLGGQPRAIGLSVEGNYAFVGLAADPMNAASTPRVVAVNLGCAFP